MSYPPPIPNAPLPPLGYAQPVRNDLRLIAVRQRAIMYCILGYIVCGIAYVAAPLPLKLLLSLVLLGAIITAAVFVFMLSIAIYGTGAGIVLGILTLIPLIGLIVLLIVNGKATSILRANKIRVGLMGADPNQIPSA